MRKVRLREVKATFLVIPLVNGRTRILCVSSLTPESNPWATKGITNG